MTEKLIDNRILSKVESLIPFILSQVSTHIQCKHFSPWHLKIYFVQGAGHNYDQFSLNFKDSEIYTIFLHIPHGAK